MASCGIGTLITWFLVADFPEVPMNLGRHGTLMPA